MIWPLTHAFRSFVAQTASERLGRLKNRRVGDWATPEQGPVEL